MICLLIRSDNWWRHQTVSTKKKSIKLDKIVAEGSDLYLAVCSNQRLKRLSLALALFSRSSLQRQIKIMKQLLNHNFKPSILKQMKKWISINLYMPCISVVLSLAMVYIYFLLQVRFLKPANRAQEVVLWVCTSNLVWYSKIRRQRHSDLS